MKLRGFIFDLDGTLLNTLPLCYIGFRSTLLKFTGREYSDREIKDLFGPSEEGVLKKLLPEKWEESLQHYLDIYDKAHLEYSKPFPGIEELLSLLIKQNLRLGIVSGKGPGTMTISLRHSGLEKYFEIVQTGSANGANKPANLKKIISLWNFNPREVAYVGDMAYDIISAKEAGTISVGAIWANTTNRQRVLDMNPDFAFEMVHQFMEWIEVNI
ncbi:MAG TPA: HAD-IA family hydrolase [Desulfitobacteriaceae bacterium]|nr:HAD-IA family hydrolase [Desulfitobacteriaceae bacterium]